MIVKEEILIGSKADTRGFKKAQTASEKLRKSVKSLGSALGVGLGTVAIVSFGKASVKAFGEAERSNVQLANAVKNLGLSFEQARIASSLDEISASSGIAGEVLNQAFQSLLTTTGSVTKSQELLNLALDVSTGTGKDLASVSNDLAQAYVGNTKGLRKYNLGLTQAELKTASFATVQAKLNKQFSGANANYLQTYAGKMQFLAEAAGNAQEIVGKGLVDALVLASGQDADIQDVADAMKNLADYTANASRGVGVLIGKISDLDKQKSGGFFSKLISKNFEYSLIGQLNKLGTASQNVATGGSVIDNYNMTANAKKIQQDRAKSEAAAKKRAADILKAQQKNTAELKKQAALKKAGTLFDLDQIQLIAALKSKLSDEDRKRVELQLALLTGNVTEAQKLAYEVAKAAGLSESLARSLATLPDAKNPFQAWDEYLNMLLKKVQSIVTGAPLTGTTGPTPVVPTNTVSSYTGTPFGQAGSFVDTIGTPFGQAGGNGSGYIGTPFGQAQPIVVQIDGKTVASSIQDQSLSGNNTTVNRLTGGWSL